MITPRHNLNLNHLVNERAPLNRGLLAWYLAMPGMRDRGFTWRDLTGGHHDGTLTNFTPAAASGWGGSLRGNGGFGRLKFDGSDDVVNLGDNFGGLAAMTISCWAFVAATPGGGTPFHLVSKFGNNGAFDASDSFALYYDGNFNLILGGPNVNAASSPFAINTLVYITATYDGANIFLYSGGVQVGTAAASGTINASSGTDTLLGFSVDTNFSSHFNGWLDDVRIYNRALSALDAYSLFRASELGYPLELNRTTNLPVGIDVSAEAAASLWPNMSHDRSLRGRTRVVSY